MPPARDFRARVVSMIKSSHTYRGDLMRQIAAVYAQMHLLRTAKLSGEQRAKKSKELKLQLDELMKKLLA